MSLTDPDHVNMSGVSQEEMQAVAAAEVLQPPPVAIETLSIPNNPLGRALTLLVHGLSKAGKSSLSVTAPKPLVYCDAESASRFLSVARPEDGKVLILPRTWNPLTEAPPVVDGTWDTAVVPTRTWEDVLAVYQWLNSGQHPFRSLVIDSVSELQARYIEKVAGREQATMNQWGTVFRQVAGLLKDIRDLTMHPTHPLECIAMTAMTKEVNGVWKPYVSGQLQTVLPYLWDVVGYLYTESVAAPFDPTQVVEARRLLTRRTPSYEAGERVQGRIPIVVPDPDIEQMISMIFGAQS